MNTTEFCELFYKTHEAYFGTPHGFLTKINENDECVKRILLFFASKWQNVDPEIYIRCGFDLFRKEFCFDRFFDDRIMRKYIQHDKSKKRELFDSKQSLIDSAKYVLSYMKEHKISFNEYLVSTIGMRKLIIEHYLKNNLSPLFFCYFIYLKQIKLNDEDAMFLPYINIQYKRCMPLIKKNEDFLMKIEDKLYGTVR